MRKIIILLAILFITNIVYAESYLVIDKNTKEVKSLSPEDDAQLEQDWEKIVLKEEFKDIELNYHPTYYFWKNDRFVANIKKLSDEALADQEMNEKIKERELMNKEIEQMAIKALKQKGVTLKHYTEEE